MKNLISNLTATGNWQELTDIPQRCQGITLQARDPDNTMNYRFIGQSAYRTVRAGAAAVLIGKFANGDLEVQGTAADVIEIEYSPTGYSL